MYLSTTPGFCGFCNPSNAKPSFLRVGGGRFRHLFECFSEGRFWMRLFPDFCRFWSLLGRLLDVLWPPFSVHFSGNFFDGFGVPAGGTIRRGRSTSPGLCFSTFWLKPAISPCVFLMFSGLLDSGAGGERDFLWKSTSLRGSLGGVFRRDNR